MWMLTFFIFKISFMCKNVKTLQEMGKKTERIICLLPADTSGQFAVANTELATWLTLVISEP